MPKPVVVIIGRPNVGKSTLFNRIVGRQAAIVQDVPGVTRDRNYMDAEWEDRAFVVVDTGGFYTRTPDNIFEQIKEQALFAMEEADLIIHMLDAKDGVNPYDEELVKLLRASGTQVIWAVNKIDTLKAEERLYEFYSLGIDDPLPVSAASGLNYDELMDRVIAALPPYEAEATTYPRIAVVGRPNAGKSTLINSLLGKKRLLVSSEPGTTRDSIDSLCSYYSRKYLLVDTAGIRRKFRQGYNLERFAMVRAMRSIERSDVTLILIDASKGVVTDDQRIAGMVRDYGRGAIILFNKFDLAKDPEKDLKRLKQEVERKLFFLSHAPVLTTSGLTKKRMTKIFPLIDQVMQNMNRRVPTPELNRFAEKLRLPTVKGKQVKVYYMAQVSTNPPVFTMFVNKPEGIKDSHLKNIKSQIRERFPLEGVPIIVRVKGRG